MSGDTLPGATPPAAGPTLRQVVTVTNPQGLHMRPASAFAKRAREFASAVTVIRDEREVNGKSQLDLLMLAAEPGAELVIEVCGDDAQSALPVLADLLACPGEPDTEQT
jgi:phosphotransferase system HPr (HPr) family protein